MCSRFVGLTASILVLAACGGRTAGIATEGVIQAINYGYMNRLLGKERVLLAIEPETLPASLSVGDELLVHVTPLLFNGMECELCRVRWDSSERDIAYWTDPETLCPKERCALLRALSPGRTVLTVEVCPSEGRYEDCFLFKIGEPDIH